MSMNVPSYKSVRVSQIGNVSRLPIAVGNPSGSVGGVRFGADVRRGINANSNVAPVIKHSGQYASTLKRLRTLLKLSRKNVAIWAGTSLGEYAGDQLATKIWAHFNATAEGYNFPDGITTDGDHLYINGGYKYSGYPDTPAFSYFLRGRTYTLPIPNPNWIHAYTEHISGLKFGHTYSLMPNTVPKPLTKPRALPMPYSEPPLLPHGQPEPMPNLMPRIRVRRKQDLEPLPFREPKANSFTFYPNGKMEIGYAQSKKPKKNTSEAKATGAVGAILSFMGKALDFSTEMFEVLVILYDHAKIPKNLDMRTRTELYFLHGGWKRTDDLSALFVDLAINHLTDKYIYGPAFGAVSKSARKHNLTGYNPQTHMPNTGV